MPDKHSAGRIVVVISGSGSNLQAIMDGCALGKIQGDISAVISNIPDVYGLKRAKKAGIHTEVINHKAFSDRNTYDQALGDLIDSFNPDLVVLAGFMRILSSQFVSRYRGKLVNIHPSLLPKYTGLNTHQRALENGDIEHGATVHFVTEKLDGGPPIIQGAITIHASDDASSLASRVQTDIEHKIYPLAIHWCLSGAVTMSGNNVLLHDELLSSSGYQYRPE